MLIAISRGEGGLRALERPAMLPNHPVARGGCWRGSVPWHELRRVATPHGSCWVMDPLQQLPEHPSAEGVARPSLLGELDVVWGSPSSLLGGVG